MAENDSVEDEDRVRVMSAVDKVVNEHHEKLEDIQKQFTDIQGVSIALQNCMISDFLVDVTFYHI